MIVSSIQNYLIKIFIIVRTQPGPFFGGSNFVSTTVMKEFSFFLNKIELL